MFPRSTQVLIKTRSTSSRRALTLRERAAYVQHMAEHVHMCKCAAIVQHMATNKKPDALVVSPPINIEPEVALAATNLKRHAGVELVYVMRYYACTGFGH
jgi:hypothetical protein